MPLSQKNLYPLPAAPHPKREPAVPSLLTKGGKLYKPAERERGGGRGGEDPCRAPLTEFSRSAFYPPEPALYAGSGAGPPPSRSRIAPPKPTPPGSRLYPPAFFGSNSLFLSEQLAFSITQTPARYKGFEDGQEKKRGFPKKKSSPLRKAHPSRFCSIRRRMTPADVRRAQKSCPGRTAGAAKRRYRDIAFRDGAQRPRACFPFRSPPGV